MPTNIGCTYQIIKDILFHNTGALCPLTHKEEKQRELIHNMFNSLL